MEEEALKWTGEIFKIGDVVCFHGKEEQTYTVIGITDKGIALKPN